MSGSTIPIPQAIVPYVIESTPRGERGMDIWSRLLRDRIVFLGTPIDDVVANSIVAQLLLLKSEDPDKLIQMFINCPGGSISAGLAIYDTMQYIMQSSKCQIHTTCFGLAASFGSVILAGGYKGNRTALPNATIHLHQPWGQGGGGQATDIEIHAREIIRQRALLNEVLVHHTGQPLEKIQHDTDRDFFMNAEQAVEYGLIDEVIATAEAVPEAAG